MKNDDRHIIPRWISPFNNDKQKLPSFLQKPIISASLSDWKATHSIGTAEDLISTAFLTNDYTNSDVITAAKFILDKGTLKGSRNLAKHIIDPSALAPKVSINIRQCRRMVRLSPYNGILRIEYARQLLIAGLIDKAHKQIQIAVAMAPNHSWVIRSALRFCCHNNDSDRGLWYLRRAYNNSSDISLIAPEIAASAIAETNSKLLKLGRSVPFAESTPDSHAGEILAGTITHEIEFGNIRKAKKMLSKYNGGLNENSLAQFLWLADEYNFQLQLNCIDNIVNPYEVNARIASLKGNDKKAVKACLQWFEFQPFSASPAVYGSYIASMILEDHQSSINLLEGALLSSKGNMIVWNNLAFDYLHTNNLSAASNALKKAEALESDENEDAIILKATKGLYLIKSGNEQEGDQHYKDAISFFHKEGNTDNETICRCMWALTLHERSSPYLQRQIRNIENLIKKTNDNHTLKIAKRTLTNIKPEKSSIVEEVTHNKIIINPHSKEDTQLTISFDDD